MQTFCYKIFIRSTPYLSIVTTVTVSIVTIPYVNCRPDQPQSKAQRNPLAFASLLLSTEANNKLNSPQNTH